MTYASLAVVVVLACSAVTAVAVATERRRGRAPSRLVAVTVLTALVLLVLTVVFDSAMVAADLFRYDESALVGLRIGLAPVEDLAWPVATALLLPSLAALLEGRARVRDAAGAPGTPRLVDTAPAGAARLPEVHR
ncbi:lycopene cyclase domain-containing protein [Cellulomonas persica]|uniref:Lycopene cyclase domain-containing protein n=1 Tax=Cellulomonas persica TaxID=76861 RepID=A0A510UPZ6_9CELL|nr:lycopene cyclase domain-containing protein [Cellulomonas persica]GEK16737.1 hypothetical protein CPE01_04700 [Cellulomonas persica]